MKSREDFLQLVYDKAAVEDARRKKQKKKAAGILICSFAFLLICGRLLYPALWMNKSAMRTAGSTEMAAAEMADAALTDESFAETPGGSAAGDLDDGALADAVIPREAPSYVLFSSKALENGAAEEVEFAVEDAAPYTVADSFMRMPTLYGYTVDYTDTEIRITVYTDLLPSEVGSYYFELPVWLDETKQNTLPVKTEFVLK